MSRRGIRLDRGRARTLAWVGQGWLVLFLLFPSAAQAEGKIRIEVSVGFSAVLPVVRPGCWTPVRVIVTNEGDPFESELVIQQKHAPQSYAVPVNLPSDSRLAYRLSMLPVAESLQFPDDDLLEVRLTHGRTGREVMGEVAPLRFAEPGDRVIVACGAEGLSYGHLGLRRREDEPTAAGRVVVPGRAELLPEQVIEYESVWAVVWDGQDWSSLTPGQVEALLQFVDMGGTLLIGAGPEWQMLMRSPLPAHLPVAYEGVSVVGPTAGWESLAVLPPTLPEGLIGAFGEPRAGAEVLVTAEGRPLIVRSRYGGGSIIQVGVRLGDDWWRTWPERERFFESVFRDGGLPERIPDTDMSWISVFGLGGYVRLPARWQVVALLLAYLLVGIPGGYFLFRRKDPLFAWLFLIALAVLAGVGIYGVGSRLFSGQASARWVTFLHTRAGSRYALADTKLLLYSPATRRYEVMLPPRNVLAGPGSRSPSQFLAPWYAGSPVGVPMAVPYPSSSYASPGMIPYPLSEESMSVPTQVSFSPPPRIRGFEVPQWSSVMLPITSVVDLGRRIDGALIVREGELRVRFDRTVDWYQPPIVLANEWTQPRFVDAATGDLGPDVQSRLGDPWVRSLLASGLIPQQNSRLFSAGPSGEWRSQRLRKAYLMLNPNETHIPCTISPAVRMQEVAIWAAVEIPVTVEGSQIDVPPGAWDWTVEEGSAASQYSDLAGRGWSLPGAETLPLIGLDSERVVFRLKPKLGLHGWQSEGFKVAFVVASGPGAMMLGDRAPDQVMMMDRYGAPVVMEGPVELYELEAFDFTSRAWSAAELSAEATAALDQRFWDPVHRELLLAVRARAKKSLRIPFSLRVEARFRRKEAS